MAKRGNNEGNIRLRSNGYWEARVTVGRNPNGTLKRVSYYGKTRKEAADKLNKALSELNQNKFITPNGITFSQWLDTWLETYARPHIKIATYTSYETYIRGHIKPYFGKTKLRNLTADSIQKFLNLKQVSGRLDGKSGGVSSKTIKNIYNMIHAALSQAYQNGIIDKNISELVRTPKIERKEMRVLTRSEQKSLIEVCNNSFYGLIPITALFTGMRLGEILGAQWSSVDFERNVIVVRNSLKRQRDLSNKENKTVLTLDTPKSAKSLREIPLIDDMVNRLEKHKVQQLQLKVDAGSAYNDRNFIFANSIGDPYDQRTFKKYYRKLLLEADINIEVSPTGVCENVTFHTLRHTFATRALELGFDVKVLADILGHADASTTLNKYGHALPDHKKSTMDKLNELV